MAKVTAASAAMHFGAGRKECIVGLCPYCIRQSACEAGPSGATVILIFRRVEGEITARTMIQNYPLFVVQVTGISNLGFLIAHHQIFCFTQTVPPLRFGSRDLECLLAKCG